MGQSGRRSFGGGIARRKALCSSSSAEEGGGGVPRERVRRVQFTRLVDKEIGTCNQTHACGTNWNKLQHRCCSADVTATATVLIPAAGKIGLFIFKRRLCVNII